LSSDCYAGNEKYKKLTQLFGTENHLIIDDILAGYPNLSREAVEEVIQMATEALMKRIASITDRIAQIPAPRTPPTGIPQIIPAVAPNKRKTHDITEKVQEIASKAAGRELVSNDSYPNA